MKRATGSADFDLSQVALKNRGMISTFVNVALRVELLAIAWLPFVSMQGQTARMMSEHLTQARVQTRRAGVGGVTWQ
jgi:hypothetical protein